MTMHGTGDEIGVGFEVFAPKVLSTPLIFNSPHSGARYPKSFLDQSGLDALALRRSEDAFVDELFESCVGLGAPLLKAYFPRAYIDVNREAFELDPQMFEDRLPAYVNTRSLRVAGGLGTIPRVVGDAQPIYRRSLRASEALQRIERFYRPYHAKLRELVDAAHRLFGLAVLVDCHSMPSNLAEGAQPDFVIGDRFGDSAAPWVAEMIESSLQKSGFRVRRNKPYAGGFITEHYGAPGAGRHAVQIEVNRALYMDEKRIAKLPAMRNLREYLLAMGEDLRLRAELEIRPRRVAAE
jgi:N-formylglutamate amidohydrolase